MFVRAVNYTNTRTDGIRNFGRRTYGQRICLRAKEKAESQMITRA